MTNRTLRYQLFWIFFLVGNCLLISLLEYCYRGTLGPTFISSNATLLAIIFGAYLAFLFQQRSKSVDDIRRWWNEIVLAKSEIFLYCDKSKPTEDDYLKAFYKLSAAMDSLRLIYCNVGRTKENSRGLYPFEQVRDIVDIARSIAPNRKDSLSDRQAAKKAIDIVFQSLRHAIQSEANAAPPDEPTLYRSQHRQEYKAKVLKEINLDIETIRKSNHSL